MSLDTIVPINRQLDKLDKYLKSLADGTEIQLEYLPTINRLIGGFERRKLVVIGSRPSEGKSTFALQMGYELSVKFKVLYISLEMTVEEATFRLLCYQQRTPNTDFYRGLCSNYKPVLDNFKTSLTTKERMLIICQEIGRSWEEVSEIFALLGEDCPDIIIVDYVQCIKTEGKKLEAIEDYIKRFRELAIQKNFCLFLCSQINRQNVVDNKEPTMEGLKNTGFLEEHADKVILLHYPCKKSPTADMNHYKIIVAKNKNGMTGYYDCKITPETYRIYEEEKIPQEKDKVFRFAGMDNEINMEE